MLWKNKWKFTTAITIASVVFLSGCSNPKKITKNDLLSDKPNGVYYEIFVRSFADSNGDGIGDFKGITNKLDYLSDLGVEGLWLMPIHPSPSYHGYDITDYRDVNSDYGSMEDFKTLINEAHKRNMDVLIDLVINHTSKEHPWFQKALSGDKKYENYYVWSNQKEVTDAIGEWNQTAWHGLDEKKYEGIFWDGMPDLNYDNKEVRKEMKDIGTFWLKEVGIDGFRIDAAKHIYSKPYVTNDEEKDVSWWKEFRSEMEKINPNVHLVGEVWASPSEISPYLNKGLNSAFDFDLSSKILSAVKDETDNGIASSLETTRSLYKETSQDFFDSTMITNHDMNRTMDEVGDDINKAKMAASLLLTLPGNPYLYYGEEIGMKGSKPDEEIREPFNWSKGETKDETTWELAVNNSLTVSANEQLKDNNSLLNHYKNMIYLRRSHPVLISGEVVSGFYNVDGLIVFERVWKKERLLIVHNVSSKPHTLELFDTEKDYKKIYFNNGENELKNHIVKMKPYSTLVLEKK